MADIKYQNHGPIRKQGASSKSLWLHLQKNCLSSSGTHLMKRLKTCLSCFAVASTLSCVHEVSLLSMLNLLLIGSYKCILTRHGHVSCRAWRSFWLMKMASTLIELQRLLSHLDMSWFHIFLLVSQFLIILLTFAGNREDQGCKEQILTRKVCYFNQFKNLDGLCCCWCFRECKPSFWILKKICVFMNYKCSMNLHWILTVCRLESFFGGVVATSSTPKRKVRTYSNPSLTSHELNFKLVSFLDCKDVTGV